MFKFTLVLLNPDLSFFETTDDHDQLASDSHLIRIHTVFHFVCNWNAAGPQYKNWGGV